MYVFFIKTKAHLIYQPYLENRNVDGDFLPPSTSDVPCQRSKPRMTLLRQVTTQINNGTCGSKTFTFQFCYRDQCSSPPTWKIASSGKNKDCGAEFGSPGRGTCSGHVNPGTPRSGKQVSVMGASLLANRDWTSCRRRRILLSTWLKWDIRFPKGLPGVPSTM